MDTYVLAFGLGVAGGLVFTVSRRIVRAIATRRTARDRLFRETGDESVSLGFYAGGEPVVITTSRRGAAAIRDALTEALGSVGSRSRVH